MGYRKSRAVFSRILKRSNFEKEGLNRLFGKESKFREETQEGKREIRRRWNSGVRKDLSEN